METEVKDALETLMRHIQTEYELRYRVAEAYGIDKWWQEQESHQRDRIAAFKNMWESGIFSNFTKESTKYEKPLRKLLPIEEELLRELGWGSGRHLWGYNDYHFVVRKYERYNKLINELKNEGCPVFGIKGSIRYSRETVARLKSEIEKLKEELSLHQRRIDVSREAALKKTQEADVLADEVRRWKLHLDDINKGKKRDEQNRKVASIRSPWLNDTTHLLHVEQGAKRNLSDSEFQNWRNHQNQTNKWWG